MAHQPSWRISKDLIADVDLAFHKAKVDGFQGTKSEFAAEVIQEGLRSLQNITHADQTAATQG